jgi:hypothetical protein
MKKKHFTIGLAIIFIISILGGCEEIVDTELKDNIKELNLIEVVLDIEVLAQTIYKNKTIPDAGTEVRFLVLKDGVVKYNDTHSSDSSGKAGAVVGFNVFPDEKVKITASLEHVPKITATEEYNYVFFEKQASLGEPFDRCVYLVEIMLPIYEYPIIE